MLNRDLKLVSNQYDDNAVVFIKIGMGTLHRLDKCNIESSEHDPDLYEVKSIEKDDATSSMVLTIE